MMDKEQAKEKLKSLVADFKNNIGYYKKLSEADVEDKLVNELFVNILGWDKKDYEKRAKARRGDKGGSADYAFKINDRIVFFLEVKKVTIPLDKEANEQVILYSLSKKIPLAISTNFQQMNIFCVEQENAIQNVFRNFKTPEDYVNNFQDLLFLSKESFEQGLLLKKAEDEGRLKRRVSIDKVLLDDFWRVRTLIASDIEKNKPGKYTINEKDEIVQRILDRLIFIRRCEDSGINPDNLTLEEIKHSATSRAYSQLKTLFTKYDSVYNSGLFTPNKDNDCDIITINGEIIQKLISYLYESHDGKYKYNFEWIDADVLGQVYEQYLGKILAQTKSGKAKLKEGQAHRKEQGIYYTPTYIVDYIVKNTLGELLKDKKVDARKIKILDPACGSGSFLIKAFDYLNEHLSKDEEAKQHKLDFQTKDAPTYSIKTEILKNNIYGVDLDNKAVEITKLNLLLKAAEKFRKLPSELDNHIGWGNSLIDDDAFEHPFKWVGDFQEGTFDVVIGNPPYVEARQIEQIYVDYYRTNFESAGNRVNTFPLFIERSIKLLRDGGYFGMIVHKNSIRSNDYVNLRNFVLQSCKIQKIIPLYSGVFDGVTGEMVVIVFQKDKNQSSRIKNMVLHGDKNNIMGYNNYQKLSQKIFYDIPGNRFNVYLNEKKIRVLEHIKANSVELKEVAETKQGIIVGDEDKYIKKNKESAKYKPILRGRNIYRYGFNFTNEYLYYVPGTSVLKRGKTSDLFEKDEKILTQHVSGKIIATLDTESYYALQTINLIYSKGNIKNKYLLAILNSKLLNFYYDSYFNMGSEFTTAVATENLDLLPIKIVSESQQQPIIKLVDHMLSLNKQLQEIGDKKTAQTAKLEEEIKKTDEEIDDLVYKIYSITEEEKKIIEESLK